MRGAPHKGLAWVIRRIRSRMFAATSGLPGRRRDFPGPMPGESSAVPTDDCVGLNYLETSPPAGPESVQHNPQEPVAAVEAQATRRVLLENRKLVAKREYLCLQGSTGSKTGGYRSKKGNERELIVVATMISRMARTPVFSDRTEFSVTTGRNSCIRAYGWRIVISPMIP